MGRYYLLLSMIVTFQFRLDAAYVAEDFLLDRYQEIAICTDLEPDDVLALKIIFDYVNRHYTVENYPIKLLVVGEGNSAIKKRRMETMLIHYFQVPQGVIIEVAEGHSSQDNLFPYDGMEMFCKNELVPAPDTHPQGQVALDAFCRFSKEPLIIQLMPGSELLELAEHKEIASKVTILMYGGFNLRKTVPTDWPGSFSERLERMIKLFSTSFSKIAILETYSVLGDPPNISMDSPGTIPVIQKIQNSTSPFYQMFRRLVNNWNHYLWEKKRESTLRSIKMLGSDHLVQHVETLMVHWDPCLFARVRCELNAHHLKDPSLANPISNLERDLKFLRLVHPDVGLQLTLADVCAAMALTDRSNLFHAQPISVRFDSKGYLNPSEDLDSNIIYYGPVNRFLFFDRLLKLVG